MTDGDAVAHVDELSPSGMNSWTVDGTSELNQQSFWFRIGNSAAQQAVYSLALKNISQDQPNALTTEHANSQFDFTVNYTLTGGSSGSARMNEVISIQNLRNTTLDFHLFQYADFDLAGTKTGDTISLGSVGGLFTSASQTDGGLTAVEVLGTGANHGQAALGNVLYSTLTSGKPTTLNGTAGPLGPGDAVYAFEWDLTIAPKACFTMSLDKYILPVTVPEPSTLTLAALGLVALFRRRLSRV